MIIRGYKEALKLINQQKKVILVISLWTYSSKRMTFKVPFDSGEACFDYDMIAFRRKERFKFVTVNGESYSFDMDKLKIAKLDHVEVVE